MAVTALLECLNLCAYFMSYAIDTGAGFPCLISTVKLQLIAARSLRDMIAML